MGQAKQAGIADQVNKPVAVQDGTSQRLPNSTPGLTGFEVRPFCSANAPNPNESLEEQTIRLINEQMLCSTTAVTPVAATPPPQSGTLTAGQQLTYDQEGEVLTPYHPTAESGVTIGVGYDMKERTKEGIISDLTGVGVLKKTAETLGGAAGLSHKKAGDFVKDNGAAKLTQAQSQALFPTIYKVKADYAEKLATKKDVTDNYGVTDWAKLDSKIKDVLIDMTFRGDYTGSVREEIQEFVVKNDPAGFKKAISDKTIFPNNLSKKRFQARIDHM